MNACYTTNPKNMEWKTGRLTEIVNNDSSDNLRNSNVRLPFQKSQDGEFYRFR